MKLPRRQFLQLAAGAAALPFMSRAAGAQAYPSRPVRIIVAYATGGPNDLFARLIDQWLSERLGQQFIVEHRAGAGGTIGTEATVRAPARWVYSSFGLDRKHDWYKPLRQTQLQLYTRYRSCSEDCRRNRRHGGAPVSSGEVCP